MNVIAPLFLTHHVSQKISTSPHDAVCKTSSLLRHPQAPPAKYSQSLSSSKPACPHSPSQHFSQVLEADPLHVTDPLTHVNYSIVCVSAQFLRIFALFFIVQTYQFLFFSYCFLRSLAKSQYFVALLFRSNHLQKAALPYSLLFAAAFALPSKFWSTWSLRCWSNIPRRSPWSNLCCLPRQTQLVSDPDIGNSDFHWHTFS